jgi:hypothetical protein
MDFAAILREQTIAVADGAAGRLREVRCDQNSFDSWNLSRRQRAGVGRGNARNRRVAEPQGDARHRGESGQTVLVMSADDDEIRGFGFGDIQQVVAQSSETSHRTEGELTLAWELADLFLEVPNEELLDVGAGLERCLPARNAVAQRSYVRIVHVGHDHVAWASFPERAEPAQSRVGARARVDADQDAQRTVSALPCQKWRGAAHHEYGSARRCGHAFRRAAGPVQRGCGAALRGYDDQPGILLLGEVDQDRGRRAAQHGAVQPARHSGLQALRVFLQPLLRSSRGPRAAR